MAYSIISTEKLSGMQNTLYRILVPSEKETYFAHVYLPDDITQEYIDNYIDNIWIPSHVGIVMETDQQRIDQSIDFLASVGIGTTSSLDEDII